MEVILLEKIRNVGDLGVKVKVKPGYARNFLLPQRKAILATPANLAKFEARRTEHEKQAADILAQARQKAEKITALGIVTIPAKIAEEGKLYGSVGIGEIADMLQKSGISVEKSEVKLPAGPIRHIGEYDIHLYFHSDVTAVIKVNVVPE
jgi:large subunit ribosomal protein L9